jgi:hypothetical protein
VNIEIRIGSIVVNGVDATSDQSRLIGIAVREQLVRQIAEHGVGAISARSGSIAQITGATFDPSLAGTPSRLGSEIGRAVHASIAGTMALGGSVLP